jgi:hypothetical protein
MSVEQEAILTVEEDCSIRKKKNNAITDKPIVLIRFDRERRWETGHSIEVDLAS